MNKFICTFGCGTPLAACVQPVSAETDEDARRAMRYFYADKWAFCYRIGDCQLKLQQRLLVIHHLFVVKAYLSRL